MLLGWALDEAGYLFFRRKPGWAMARFGPNEAPPVHLCIPIAGSQTAPKATTSPPPLNTPSFKTTQSQLQPQHSFVLTFSSLGAICLDPPAFKNLVQNLFQPQIESRQSSFT
jgi:hypothetical protein